MKRILLTGAMLLSMICLHAAQYMTVTPLTGDPVSFRFDTQPEISFLSGKLQVKTADGTTPTKFDIDDVESITFTDAGGVDSPTESMMYFTSDADGLHYFNVAQEAQATVYDIKGVCLKSCSVSGGEFHVSRAEFGKGIYIVKINNLTTKIAF